MLSANDGVSVRATLQILPEHSRETVEQELATLDFLNTEMEAAEKRLEAIMRVSVEADLLRTLPCVSTILSMVLAATALLQRMPLRPSR